MTLRIPGSLNICKTLFRKMDLFPFSGEVQGLRLDLSKGPNRLCLLVRLRTETYSFRSISIGIVTGKGLNSQGLGVRVPVIVIVT
jgi:hypothetical protein